jgi:hypothetical protein
MTVGDMLRRMSSTELTEWIAFYALEAEDDRKAREASQPPDASRQRPP